MREADYQASVDPAGNATFGPGLVFEGKLRHSGGRMWEEPEVRDGKT